ncbi:MAG: transcription antitermination factor NusB [Chthoniobacterales bacterium]
MGVRREGREAAVQYLYQHDLNPTSELADVAVFYKMRGLSPAARRFSDVLIPGILEATPEIDPLIATNVANYGMNRLAAIDRNILRLGVYEMMHCPDVPPVVAINEAIEIAKKYSTADSGKFVNGILDKIRLSLPKQTDTAPKSEH